jgi:hypothetical protein
VCPSVSRRAKPGRPRLPARRRTSGNIHRTRGDINSHQNRAVAEQSRSSCISYLIACKFRSTAILVATLCPSTLQAVQRIGVQRPARGPARSGCRCGPGPRSAHFRFHSTVDPPSHRLPLFFSIFLGTTMNRSRIQASRTSFWARFRRGRLLSDVAKESYVNLRRFNVTFLQW